VRCPRWLVIEVMAAPVRVRAELSARLTVPPGRPRRVNSGARRAYICAYLCSQFDVSAS
jgi:hypothetical protein